jgi:hypothetical protein
VFGSVDRRGALPAAPPDVSEEWLREELTELGAHLLAGYRGAVRRRNGPSMSAHR